MAKVDSITPQMLMDSLNYDHEAGIFTWKERSLEQCKDSRSMKIFNTSHAGKEAFTTHDRDGYRMASVHGVKVKAHRAAWAMYHGKWPEGFIDHINMQRADNRICNLRIATNSQNMMNGSLRVDNSSGYKGVYWCKEKKKWAAEGKILGKKKFLGRFNTREEAHSAYRLHAEEHYKEFARMS